jgi:hypothetical protein
MNACMHACVHILCCYSRHLELASQPASQSASRVIKLQTIPPYMYRLIHALFFCFVLYATVQSILLLYGLIFRRYRQKKVSHACASRRFNVAVATVIYTDQRKPMHIFRPVHMYLVRCIQKYSCTHARMHARMQICIRIMYNSPPMYLCIHIYV